jgi:hypothetical protein
VKGVSGQSTADEATDENPSSDNTAKEPHAATNTTPSKDATTDVVTNAGQPSKRNTSPQAGTQRGRHHPARHEPKKEELPRRTHQHKGKRPTNDATNSRTHQRKEKRPTNDATNRRTSLSPQLGRAHQHADHQAGGKRWGVCAKVKTVGPHQKGDLRVRR